MDSESTADSKQYNRLLPLHLMSSTSAFPLQSPPKAVPRVGL